VIALGIVGVSGGAAHADFGFNAFDGGTFNADGSAYTQAGGHPYEAWTSFEMNRTVVGDDLRVRPDGGNIRNVQADLPPGLIGNPTAMPQCPKTLRIPTVSDIDTDPGTLCPPTSVVGMAQVSAGYPGPSIETLAVPVFNVEPPPGVAAAFGFDLLTAPAFMEASVRSDGDYGVRIRVRDANQSLPIMGVKVTLWGTPADPVHDSQRCIFLPPIPVEFLNILGFPVACDSPFSPHPPGTPAGPNPAGVPVRALLTNPTACTPPGEGLETRILAESWEPTSAPASASFTSHLPPMTPFPPAPEPAQPPAPQGGPQGPTGCDKLPFDPSFDVRPGSTKPDSPTGLTVDLSLPQDNINDPNEIATAALRDAKVTLPEGMTVNPSSAGGLEGCSDEQLGAGSLAAIQCPEASKIGTATAVTPLLETPLEGAIYVGTQKSDDPESGDMFRIFLVLEDKRHGILIKLPGKVRANAQTGRLETTFENNPQLPVTTFSLHFKQGPRAPLATPLDCGEKRVDAQLTSWGGQTATLSDSFTIECTGSGGFSPAFKAGALNPAGGGFSPFAVRIDRNDGDQFLRGVALEMPTGLIAKLKGVALCAEDQAAAGSCPIETRVGTATVGAGPGTHPVLLDGSVSLTGPYKGAPYGLSASVRAVAGPFDLGTVVVRQAIYIDPVDAHLTVVSDPLPTIIKGVPLRLRSVNVDVNRPGFTMNPTSCAEKQIKGTLASDAGVSVAVTDRFQVADCQALAFKPKLALRLTGRNQMRDGKHPGLKAVVRQRSGQANIKKVAVTLPLSLALDPDNAQALCEFEDGEKVNCPKASIIGSARAVTPVLNRPLTGPVYFVKGIRIDKRTGRRIRTLPTLLVPLRGEVSIDLRAKSSVSKNQLVNTFETVPDAPVSRFDLTLKGGKGGILAVTGNRNLCRGQQIARVHSDGQNGKRRDFSVHMKAPCAKKKAKR
jgi:hypothetical protein